MLKGATMFRIALLMLVLVSTQGLAQTDIYRTTDENGNIVFTDAPGVGTRKAERIENPHINSMPAPPSVPGASEETPDSEDDKNTSYEVSITSPENETTIPNGPGNFTVAARVSPALESGLSLQLYMDGVPWGEPQVSSSWNLTNVFRGEHQLTVAVVDEEGDAGATSEPVTVYVFRPIVGQ